ncbi:amino acid permease [Grosmannia clavigera kw1407]|uniref:Amino acid permease n=1 Tax=Grosmannia clavigera (strain kw1407 / UAMH 11150) TaxID=655863 RepID=F0XQW0_GROCL|nr:amino acid permease [Grosmannia clavigera kw1407]EFW99737.1 amino acid permease [Grosmannia clavigera kw1407]
MDLSPKKTSSLEKGIACQPVVQDRDVGQGEVIEVGDGEYRRNFSYRQIHVISLGGQIGAGLFISTGKNLSHGGPGGLLLGFLVVCSCVWALHQTLGEMTIGFPVSGNFIDFADRFVDPAFSFSAGFSMWLGWTSVIAAEAVFFTTIVNYWAEGSVPEAAWLTIFLVLLFVLFCLPNTAFGWFEYIAAILKFVALIIFLITGLCLILGAGPSGHKADGKVWTTDLAFRNGFKGFGQSTLLAILAIGDNTFTGFLAGETGNPRYSVAHAAFLIPIRVTAFYITSVVFIGLLISPTNSQLFGNKGVTASPFVIAIKQAGITGLPDFLNAIIVIAVASIAAESFFIASRILRSMAHQRLIPGILARVDAKGRPMPALLLTTAMTILMTYINLSAGGTVVFDWLSQIASTGYFMVWFFIAVTSFRFRAALKAQNDPLLSEAYAWKCALWPLPPIWLLICCCLFMACSLYLALYPIGSNTVSAHYFFQYMFGTVLILFCGIAYKAILRTKLRDPKTADLQTGRRPLSTAEIVDLDEYEKLSRWRKLYSFIQVW